jgi:TRAP-type C4-dicarboxylate transport system substrate-binding protein
MVLKRLNMLARGFGARLACLTLLLCLSPASFAESYVFKFATLVPDGTAWMKEVDRWAAEVAQKSQGRLVFKIYPGGVMGDEPDVLRKLHSQQLQGAFFTGYGVGRIFSPARVLEVPFLFRSTSESDYVRQQLMPDIEQGFRKNGFELIGWPEAGEIHFFSKYPIHSLDELRKRHVWLWQGDPLGEALASAAGISPIPLSIVDVYAQLSAEHGSIDTVYNAPFGLVAMQWNTRLKYASNVPLTNAIGALVVDSRFYARLPDDLKQLLKTTGEETGKRITAIARRDNASSIALLKKQGMQFMWDWNDKEWKEALGVRDRAAAYLAKSGYIPESYFDRTRELLEQYRKQH